MRRLRSSPKPRFFYVVRNPYKWYESWFKYQSDERRHWKNWGNAGDPLGWHPNMELNGLRADDFNSFMARMTEDYPGYVTRLYSRYGNLGEGAALKLENIRVELCDLLTELGFVFNRERIQNEPDFHISKKLPIEWDPVLRARVAELDRPAFVRYGYQG